METTTSDYYAAGYLMACGCLVARVTLSAPRPGYCGPAKQTPTFVFAGEDAQRRLEEYWRGDEGETLIPARVFKAHIDHAFRLAREARLTETPYAHTAA